MHTEKGVEGNADYRALDQVGLTGSTIGTRTVDALSTSMYLFLAIGYSSPIVFFDGGTHALCVRAAVFSAWSCGDRGAVQRYIQNPA